MNFPDTETIDQPSDDGKFTANSAPPGNHADAVDLIHFSNVAGDLAATEESSISDQRAMGARMIVLGFIIPGVKLSLVN